MRTVQFGKISFPRIRVFFMCLLAVAAATLAGCDAARDIRVSKSRTSRSFEPTAEVTRAPEKSGTRGSFKPTAEVTGPGLGKPLILSGNSIFQNITATDQRAKKPWARSLGPRFGVVITEDDYELEADVYPYARVSFPAPFIYVPPGEVRPDGSRLPSGWLRVPVGVRYRLVEAGLPPPRE